MRILFSVQICFLLINTFVNDLYGQTRSPEMVILEWHSPYSLKIGEHERIKSLYFKEAGFEHHFGRNPLYFRQLKLANKFQTVKAFITEPVYATLSPEEINAAEIKYVTDKPELEITYMADQGKPIAKLLILPFRKNALNGKFEKLLSFKLSFSVEQSNGEQADTRRTYRSNSVLAVGSWYKFRIRSSGIYKIAYSDLINMGINPAGINPSKIGIFGNGGKMLPESNAAFRYDDLTENAIYVHGEADGQFNQGDYILFYAQGISYWTPDYINGVFNHTLNKYSDHAYYYLTTDMGQAKRITVEAQAILPSNFSVTDFNDYAFHENDSLNLIKSGREWYGEVFDIITTHSFSFTFPNRKTSSRVYLKTSLAARSKDLSSSFSINAAGNNYLVSIPGVPSSYNTEYAASSQDTMSFLSSASLLNLSITYLKSGFTSIGWLDYLSLNVRRNLVFSGSQMSFRDLVSVGIGNISEFKMQNTSAETIIWDVTNFTEPKKVLSNYSGGQTVFSVATDSLREFVAHNGQTYYSVQFVEKVSNQNLHAIGWHDMIIITYPTFLQQANRLANYHRKYDSLRVYVVQPSVIYNEFSSGMADLTAIRDFMKMLYDRAGSNINQKPKYLLLFGDGSYDPKNRLPNNTNFIPTFHSANSLHPAYSYLTDDYFGLLDDTEGDGSNGNLDLGIGRMPVTTAVQAQQMVDKIFRYVGLMNNAAGSNCQILDNSQSNPFGDWRNSICMVADDEDGNLHMYQAEELSRLIERDAPAFNLDKIYFDAYPQVSTPGGQRYPEANRALNDRVQKGALIINYTGHGGETGWAHERVLEISDINSWKNTYNLPVFITATCEFSRFDDPEPSRISAGELVFLNPSGGAIAMYTTTRLAFSNTNFSINYSWYQHAFTKTDGRYPRMGDVMRKAKVSSGSTSFNRNFVLFGDPALTMAYPRHNVTTIGINGISVGPISPADSIPPLNARLSGIAAKPDTLKALAKVSFTGCIYDENGKRFDGYNGFVYPTVYDKQAENATLANDPESSIRNFNTQKNILYRGKASVINGHFSFSFIVPRDIAYRYDYGRISYYAFNGDEDANGVFSGFVVGGINSDAPEDKNGPQIRLFMNDEQFAFGGLTDQNPVLIALMTDSSGINTVGNGIGHDIVAVLNENTNKSIVLNDYYQAELNSYTSGSVKYPLNNLTEGPYRLKLKAWDVYNNSSEANTEFIVSNSAEIALSHVLNYPNPFTSHTSFMFEHNQACCELDVLVQVFTVSGKLIKSINNTIDIEGFLVGPGRITWDGRDEYGDKLGRGVYIYKVKITDKNGKMAEKFEKLVLLN